MTSSTPNHIAIIPDGNRRWAKKHAIAAQRLIYEKGSDTLVPILEEAVKAGVPFMTFWASSYSNLQGRSRALVTSLEDMTAAKFTEMAAHPLIHQHEVRVEVRGEWLSLLKPETIQAIQSTVDATAHYKKHLLTVLIGYDGRRERGAAAISLLADAMLGKIKPQTDVEAAEKLLRQHAWTGHLPDVDLVIRTGAWEDPHNSTGFLGFLTNEARYAFPEVLWPDFTPALARQVLDVYGRFERRMGK